MQRRAFLLAALAAAGCGAVPRAPNLDTLYDVSERIDPARRRPLITIPGLLGSRLRVGRDGPFAWGGDRRLSLDPRAGPREARILGLPIGEGDEPLVSLVDEVRPDGVLRRARADLIGTTLEEAVYDGLVGVLNIAGYEFSRTVEEERARSGENPGSLEFPYDWRRDIVEAAAVLDDFVERKAAQVERVRTARYGRALEAETLRFDFVAHSMGALVLRYWLMYGAADLPADGSLPEITWAGARRAGTVVFVTPPNFGSVTAFRGLIEGRSFGPLQPEYPAALLGTHPALYQLMPRDRHRRLSVGRPDGPAPGSLYDVATWEANRWGVFDPGEARTLDMLLDDADRREDRPARLRAHVARCLARAEQLHRALDRPVAGQPADLDPYLVIGTGLDTPSRGVLEETSAGLRLASIIDEEGDGVVLRASALMDEARLGNPADARIDRLDYAATLLLPGEHVEITQSPVFADNLLYWLTEGAPVLSGRA